MRRREVIVGLGAAAAWPRAARSQQQARKITRIGYLGVASASEGARGVDAFETGLRDLGYVVSESLVIEYRWANGRSERLDALAAELVGLPVNVLFAPTTAATLASKNATATIPIVFATVSGPVELGLVGSLARPGGNLTGLSYYVSPEIVGKQLELLQEAHPQLSRVAVIWNPANRGTLRLLEEAKSVAGFLGLQLRILEARRPDDVEGAFRLMAGERIDALLILPDPMLSEHRAALGHLALRSALPTMCGSREDLAPGILMVYGASRLDLLRRAAHYVDKILRGSKPANLPIEQPTRFEFLINLSTAKALGLTIPPTLLARADEVIE